jgi:hypothetical protein
MGRVRVLKMLLLVVLVLGMFPCGCALASWQENGNPVSSRVGTSENQQITSDGAGGAIMVWSYSYDGAPAHFHTYAQRVDSLGNTKWQTEGIDICVFGSGEMCPQIISDGSGGAIILWEDHRSGNYDIYAQRVGASGNLLWTANGVAVSTAAGDQDIPQLTSDGAGGAIITWQDSRGGATGDIYAQRVNASGSVLWAANGVAICTYTGNQVFPQITSDGAGGAIITWEDWRSEITDVYAQRVNASGVVQWTADGVAICTYAKDQEFVQITSDGAGGAIITWWDERNGDTSSIYAQRVDALGSVKWVANGVAICTAAGGPNSPQLTSDGTGGAIITWNDRRNGNYDVYAQRVNASGAVQWTANGVAIYTAEGDQGSLQIISDGSGGAIIASDDYRNGKSDVYAQRVEASGNVLWVAQGVAICTAADYQLDPQLTSDGAGGAIITWLDFRSGNYDIYAQRVYSGVCQYASWQANGNPFSTAAGDQWYEQITSDGSGGSIITWEDSRSGNTDIYAQRVDPSGCALWGGNGVSICTAAGEHWSPQLTSDGTGGAIIVWQDRRNYDIYAQRADAHGWLVWGADSTGLANGIAICTAAYVQQKPQIISDGSGGAIMAWEDRRQEGNYDIYAQRVDASGGLLWPADSTVAPNGIAICTAVENQINLQLISDGAGGAIIVWQDGRNSNDNEDIYTQDIYAQHVDKWGDVKWGSNGVAICTADSDQVFPDITSDGAGGAIITWEDHRNSNADVYAQRVNASGNVQWVSNGIPICTAADEQDYVQMTPDGAGGAIITWQDKRSGSNFDIYAQRVDASGSVKWASNGAAVCTAAFDQVGPQIVSNGSGGAIITWPDTRGGGFHDIYAQLVDASGNMKWTANGVAVCTADLDQISQQLCTDGWGGAIVTWQDHHNGTWDVYAERITFAGTIDVPNTPAAVRVVTGLGQNAPNPFNPLTRITFSVAARGEVSLRIYDVAGRVLRTLVEGWREAGIYSEIWDGRGDDGIVLPSGVYFYSLKAGEFVATHKMVLLK